jgi:hypothetical protein
MGKNLHLSRLGMSFGDYGDFPADLTTDKPVGFESAFIRFTKSLKITRKIYLHSVQRLLTITLDYPQRINELTTLPDENKNNLIRIHTEIREKFERILY